MDLAHAAVQARLLATERVNIRLFGYGAKGMALSMVETAIAMTDAHISAADIHRIVELAKSILSHPVELLPGVREAVSKVAAERPVVLITKGDLFHQERKIDESGHGDLFHRIEVVSEKDERDNARLLREFAVEPRQFAMVGNSVKSDVVPVLALGGYAVHVPYRLTSALERAEVDALHPRFAAVASLADLPTALARFEQAPLP